MVGELPNQRAEHPFAVPASPGPIRRVVRVAGHSTARQASPQVNQPVRPPNAVQVIRQYHGPSSVRPPSGIPPLVRPSVGTTQPNVLRSQISQRPASLPGNLIIIGPLSTQPSDLQSQSVVVSSPVRVNTIQTVSASTQPFGVANPIAAPLRVIQSQRPVNAVSQPLGVTGPRVGPSRFIQPNRPVISQSLGVARPVLGPLRAIQSSPPANVNSQSLGVASPILGPLRVLQSPPTANVTSQSFGATSPKVGPSRTIQSQSPANASSQPLGVTSPRVGPSHIQSNRPVIYQSLGVARPLFGPSRIISPRSANVTSQALGVASPTLGPLRVLQSPPTANVNSQSLGPTRPKVGPLRTIQSTSPANVIFQSPRVTSPIVGPSRTIQSTSPANVIFQSPRVASPIVGPSRTIQSTSPANVIFQSPRVTSPIVGPSRTIQSTSPANVVFQSPRVASPIVGPSRTIQSTSPANVVSQSPRVASSNVGPASLIQSLRPTNVISQSFGVASPKAGPSRLIQAPRSNVTSQSLGVASRIIGPSGLTRSPRPANQITQSSGVTGRVAGPSRPIRAPLPVNVKIAPKIGPKALTAEQQSELKNLEDIHKCIYCDKLPEEAEHNHMLLSCLHTICYDCLDFCSSRTFKMPCTKCRRSIDKSTAHPHYYLMKTPDAPKGFMPNPNCDSCTRGSLAKRYCTKCKSMLCEYCINNHTSGLETKKHLLVNTDFGCHLRIMDNKLAEPTKCWLHEVPADNYCDRCESVFCNECDPAAHEGHDVITVKEKVESYRKEMEDSTNELESLIVPAETSKKEVEMARDRVNKDDKFRLVMEGYNQLRRLLKVLLKAELLARREIVLGTNLKAKAFNSLSVGLKAFATQRQQFTNLSKAILESNDLFVHAEIKRPMTEKSNELMSFANERPFQDYAEKDKEFYFHQDGENIFKRIESDVKQLFEVYYGDRVTEVKLSNVEEAELEQRGERVVNHIMDIFNADFEESQVSAQIVENSDKDLVVNKYAGDRGHVENFGQAEDLNSTEDSNKESKELGLGNSQDQNTSEDGMDVQNNVGTCPEQNTMDALSVSSEVTEVIEEKEEPEVIEEKEEPEVIEEKEEPEVIEEKPEVIEEKEEPEVIEEKENGIISPTPNHEEIVSNKKSIDSESLNNEVKMTEQSLISEVDITLAIENVRKTSTVVEETIDIPAAAVNIQELVQTPTTAVIEELFFLPTTAAADETISPPATAATEGPISPATAAAEEPISLPTRAATEEPISRSTITAADEPISPPATAAAEEPISLPTRAAAEEPISPPEIAAAEEPISPLTIAAAEEPISPPKIAAAEEPISLPTRAAAEEPISPATAAAAEQLISPATAAAAEQLISLPTPTSVQLLVQIPMASKPEINISIQPSTSKVLKSGNDIPVQMEIKAPEAPDITTGNISNEFLGQPSSPDLEVIKNDNQAERSEIGVELQSEPMQSNNQNETIKSEHNLNSVTPVSNLRNVDQMGESSQTPAPGSTPSRKRRRKHAPMTVRKRKRVRKPKAEKAQVVLETPTTPESLRTPQKRNRPTSDGAPPLTRRRASVFANELAAASTPPIVLTVASSHGPPLPPSELRRSLRTRKMDGTPLENSTSVEVPPPSNAPPVEVPPVICTKSTRTIRTPSRRLSGVPPMVIEDRKPDIKNLQQSLLRTAVLTPNEEQPGSSRNIQVAASTSPRVRSNRNRNRRRTDRRKSAPLLLKPAIVTPNEEQPGSSSNIQVAATTSSRVRSNRNRNRSRKDRRKSAPLLLKPAIVTPNKEQPGSSINTQVAASTSSLIRDSRNRKRSRKDRRKSAPLLHKPAIVTPTKEQPGSSINIQAAASTSSPIGDSRNRKRSRKDRRKSSPLGTLHGLNSLPFLDDGQMKITNEDHNEDYCAVCRDGGTEVMICCDACPKVFHTSCHLPIVTGIPEDDWQCNICKSKSQLLKEWKSLQQFESALCNEESSAKSGNRKLDVYKIQKCGLTKKEFILSCKLLCSLYQCETSRILSVHFERFFVQKNLPGEPHHLNTVRMQLTHGIPTPFNTPADLLNSIRTMFTQAKDLYKDLDKHLEAVNEMEATFKNTLPDYFPSLSL